MNYPSKQCPRILGKMRENQELNGEIFQVPYPVERRPATTNPRIVLLPESVQVGTIPSGFRIVRTMGRIPRSFSDRGWVQIFSGLTERGKTLFSTVDKDPSVFI